MRKRILILFSLWIAIFAFSYLKAGTSYYIDADAGDGGDGSLSFPWNEISDITGLAAGDIVYLDNGTAGNPDKWRETLTVTVSGAPNNPVRFTSYDAGGEGNTDKPIISAGDILTSASFQWTLSGSGTNEYYLEADGGGDPGIVQTYVVILDGILGIEGGTLGSLVDHGWAWGNNDSLGFSTLYVADASGDPDTSGVVIEAAQRDNAVAISNIGTEKSYIIIENIRGELSNGTGGTFLAQGDSNMHHITIQNFEAFFHRRNGVFFQGTSNNMDMSSSILNGEIAYGYGNGIGAKGNIYSNILKNVTISGNKIHHIYRCIDHNYGYGVTTFFGDSFIIKENIFYELEDAAIKLDGANCPSCVGVSNSIISKNIIYDVDMNGIQVEAGSDNNLIELNWLKNYGRSGGGVDGIRVMRNSDNNIISYNVVLTGNVNSGNAISVAGNASDGSSTGNQILNNSCYQNSSNHCIAVSDIGAPSPGSLVDTKIFNNIVWVGDYATSWPFLLGPSGDGDWSGFESDYNIIVHINHSSQLVWYNGSTNESLAQWQALEVRSGYYPDLHTLEIDPGWVDPGNNNINLGPNSPCIDKGLTLSIHIPGWSDNPFCSGSDEPYNIKTRPRGSAPDIGACEAEQKRLFPLADLPIKIPKVAPWYTP